MSKTPSSIIQTESLARCLGDRVFSYSRGNGIFFLVYYGIVQIWPMYHNLDKRVWFTIIFLYFKKSLALFHIWILCNTFSYFLPSELSRIEVPKLSPSILMEIMQKHDFFKSLFLCYMHLHIVLKLLQSY